MIFPRYMMATTAWGGRDGEIDLSRSSPDLCIVRLEEPGYFEGEWAAGFGFVHVRFPKPSTRDLTTEEIASYQKKVLEAPWGTFPALFPNVAVGIDA